MLDEIVTDTGYRNLSEPKQEIVVYCKHARLDDYDQEGKLNFNNNPIYR